MEMLYRRSELTLSQTSPRIALPSWCRLPYYSCSSLTDPVNKSSSGPACCCSNSIELNDCDSARDPEIHIIINAERCF